MFIINPVLSRIQIGADGDTMCDANFCCLTSLTYVNVYNTSARLRNEVSLCNVGADPMNASVICSHVR